MFRHFDIISNQILASFQNTSPQSGQKCLSAVVNNWLLYVISCLNALPQIKYEQMCNSGKKLSHGRHHPSKCCSRDNSSFGSTSLISCTSKKHLNGHYYKLQVQSKRFDPKGREIMHWNTDAKDVRADAMLRRHLPSKCMHVLTCAWGVQLIGKFEFTHLVYI
jgi:hypothetical protein